MAAEKPLKILMLHGYTQSGASFHAKTRALEKFLLKALAATSIVPSLLYPTAPVRLLPSDVPGFSSQTQTQTQTQPNQTQPQTDMWAWYRKDDATNVYRGLEQGMATVSRTIAEAGGIDAVCGFSQGAAMASFVAAALEPGRPLPDGPAGDWARELRLANAGRPLRFAVCYSGFYAPPEALQWLYEPKIETPTLHYIGALDSVVAEDRSRALVDRCQHPTLVVHPGGHFVPISREWTTPLAGFINSHAREAETRNRSNF